MDDWLLRHPHQPFDQRGYLSLHIRTPAHSPSRGECWSGATPDSFSHLQLYIFYHNIIFLSRVFHKLICKRLIEDDFFLLGMFYPTEAHFLSLSFQATIYYLFIYRYGLFITGWQRKIK